MPWLVEREGDRKGCTEALKNLRVVKGLYNTVTFNTRHNLEKAEHTCGSMFNVDLRLTSQG